jgi:hypothetical protein
VGLEHHAHAAATEDVGYRIGAQAAELARAGWGREEVDRIVIVIVIEV